MYSSTTPPSLQTFAFLAVFVKRFIPPFIISFSTIFILQALCYIIFTYSFLNPIEFIKEKLLHLVLHSSIFILFSLFILALSSSSAGGLSFSRNHINTLKLFFLALLFSFSSLYFLNDFLSLIISTHSLSILSSSSSSSILSYFLKKTLSEKLNNILINNNLIQYISYYYNYLFYFILYFISFWNVLNLSYSIIDYNNNDKNNDKKLIFNYYIKYIKNNFIIYYNKNFFKLLKKFFYIIFFYNFFIQFNLFNIFLFIFNLFYYYLLNFFFLLTLLSINYYFIFKINFFLIKFSFSSSSSSSSSSQKFNNKILLLLNLIKLKSTNFYTLFTLQSYKFFNFLILQYNKLILKNKQNLSEQIYQNNIKDYYYLTNLTSSSLLIKYYNEFEKNLHQKLIYLSSCSFYPLYSSNKINDKKNNKNDKKSNEKFSKYLLPSLLFIPTLPFFQQDSIFSYFEILIRTHAIQNLYDISSSSSLSSSEESINQERRSVIYENWSNYVDGVLTYIISLTSQFDLLHSFLYSNLSKEIIEFNEMNEKSKNNTDSKKNEILLKEEIEIQNLQDLNQRIRNQILLPSNPTSPSTSTESPSFFNNLIKKIKTFFYEKIYINILCYSYRILSIFLVRFIFASLFSLPIENELNQLRTIRYSTISYLFHLIPSIFSHTLIQFLYTISNLLKIALKEDKKGLTITTVPILFLSLLKFYQSFKKYCDLFHHIYSIRINPSSTSFSSITTPTSSTSTPPSFIKKQQDSSYYNFNQKLSQDTSIFTKDFSQDATYTSTSLSSFTSNSSDTTTPQTEFLRYRVSSHDYLPKNVYMIKRAIQEVIVSIYSDYSDVLTTDTLSEDLLVSLKEILKEI